MKRAGMAGVILMVAALAAAQSPSGQQSQPAAQPGAAQPSATAPQGKRPPQAKTQPEYEAYKAALASESDPVALEKAADDFAEKFPTSELRSILYRTAMRLYQNANNGDKMSETAQKILKIDPDDPEALVDSAEVIADRTRDTDIDKEQRWDEATKQAQHALETVDTDFPAGMPPDKVELYKDMIRSTAYAILGNVSDRREKYADSENYYRKSIDALPSQPDPVVVLSLGLALDKQGKYADALKEVNHAVELTQDNTSAGRAARQEQSRLMQLTGGSNSAPASAPPAGAPNSNQPPH
jgi:tetratricopeptide (TPR) repeat protein